MADQAPAKPRLSKIRVTNVSKNKSGGMGCFLDPGADYGNRLIKPGGSMIFDCPNGLIPEAVEHWGDLVAVFNAENGDQVSGPVGGELTPGGIAPVREMIAGQDDLFDEGEPDLGDALEAQLPHDLLAATQPISGDLSQQSRARVTLGSRDEGQSHDISPIPGDRPRSVDDNEYATIRAPRSSAVGAVISKGK